jgi:diguanylate cyclase (GGDEF)-like protein
MATGMESGTVGPGGRGGRGVAAGNGGGPHAAAVLAAIRHVIYDWSIPEDVIRWGDNALDVLGVDSLDRIGSGRAFASLLDPAHPESRHRVVLAARDRDEGDGVSFEVQYPLLPAGGTGGRLWIEDIGRWYGGPDGRPTRAHGLLRVISERHEREKRLAFLSRYDELTGCFNRSQLLASLGDALERAARNGKEAPIAFLVVAIDNLPVINEAYGFEIGDQIVSAVAQRIRTRLRVADVIGRYTGSRLGLLLRRCGDEEMAIAAARFRSAVHDDVIATETGTVAVTVSIGGVSLPANGTTTQQAMARAQEALDVARQKGAGHFAAYRHSPAQQARRRANAALSTELVAALHERRLELAFQPVVHVRTRAPLFEEALVRIARPGTTAIGDFAAFAERLGLIRLIDRHVLDLALDTLRRSKRAISINVSADTVSDGEWKTRLAGAAAAFPGIAERLIVEITETAMIKNLEEASDFVHALRAAGCRVAIDDFGAGFSSFRNLRVLDVDIVKIDGTFIENLASSRDDQVFVRVLVDLAKSFGIMTIAEWVQDEATVEILDGFGVDGIQGRLVGAPAREQ